MNLRVEKTPHCTKALIFAAGLGARLLPYTAKSHKSLLEFNGEPLIVRSIRQLHNVGVKQVVIVLGHNAMVVQALIQSFLSVEDIQFVLNEQYAVSGTSFSFLAAKSMLKGCGFYTLVGDLVIQQVVLEQLKCAVEGTEGNESYFVVTHDYNDEAMKVALSEKGEVLRLGKELQAPLNLAISIGLTYYSAGLVEKLYDGIEERIVGKKTANGMALLDVLNERLVAGDSIKPLFIDNVTWDEIDTLEDYQRVIGQWIL